MPNALRWWRSRCVSIRSSGAVRCKSSHQKPTLVAAWVESRGSNPGCKLPGLCLVFRTFSNRQRAIHYPPSEFAMAGNAPIISDVRSAIDIYLEHAYGAGDPPGAVKAAVRQLRQADDAEMLALPVWERDRAQPCCRYCLRLGNR